MLQILDFRFVTLSLTGFDIGYLHIYHSPWVFNQIIYVGFIFLELQNCIESEISFNNFDQNIIT